MTSTYVHLYKIGNMYDYMTSKMPSETSCLDEFKLTYLDDNEFIFLSHLFLCLNQILQCFIIMHFPIFISIILE